MIFRRARLDPVQPREEMVPRSADPWPGTPPRMQQQPPFPFSPRGAMTGIVNAEFDPCGAGPIKSGEGQ